jgi:hypothetical protein
MTSLAGCAEGTERAEAEEAQPTVLESAADNTEGGDVEPSPEGEEGEPGDGAPEESEPTPVPASSEGPAQDWPAPEPPEEIYAPTEEGAEALLQYWFDARHYARITGDTARLEDVSHVDCEMCDGHIDRVLSAFPDAWWVENEADEIHDSYVRLESEDTATGLFAHRSVSFEAYKDGELDSEYPGGTDSGFGFALVFEGDHWQMYDLAYIGEYEELERDHRGEDLD